MTSEEFKIWANKRGIKILDELGSFKVGQTVKYTNEFGVSFIRKIIGFRSEPVLEGRCVYLDKDSYWFPVGLNQIKKNINFNKF